jgi:hypothetical protein
MGPVIPALIASSGESLPTFCVRAITTSLPTINFQLVNETWKTSTIFFARASHSTGIDPAAAEARVIAHHARTRKRFEQTRIFHARGKYMSGVPHAPMSFSKSPATTRDSEAGQLRKNNAKIFRALGNFDAIFLHVYRPSYWSSSKSNEPIGTASTQIARVSPIFHDCDADIRRPA